MEAGTSPAATDGGIRPLHIAARFGHQSVVRLLVDRGADMDCATQRQLLTPLLIAAACGQTSIVVRRGKGGSTPACDGVGSCGKA